MKYKNLGFGLGLRPTHFSEIQDQPNRVDWFEALTENYMGLPGAGQSSLLEELLKVREDYPIVLHCVSSNIGSVDGIDTAFLSHLKELIQVVSPEWISDHLCWTGIHGKTSHELLPLPYTEEAVATVSNNLLQAQEILGQRFMIENTSSYMNFEHSEMEEWEFISEIVQRSDCGVLLDVNNIFVSSQNHDFDPYKFIDGMPKENIGQIHLAGHIVKDNGLIIDTHDQPVRKEVFELLKYTYETIGPVSTMVEWDGNIPSYAEYVGELDKARAVFTEVFDEA